MKLFLIVPVSLEELIINGKSISIRPALFVSENEEAARAEYLSLYEIPDGDFIICHPVDKVGDYKIIVEEQ